MKPIRVEVKIILGDGSEQTIAVDNAELSLNQGTREITREALQDWREIQLDGTVTIHITGLRSEKQSTYRNVQPPTSTPPSPAPIKRG